MMYKDKARQREAAKLAKARWKAKQGIPLDEGIQGIPEEGIPFVEGGSYSPFWMTPIQVGEWMRKHVPEEVARLRAESERRGYRSMGEVAPAELVEEVVGMFVSGSGSGGEVEGSR